MPNRKKQSNISTERPPVVAVMGHIDHGKSTLLDYIRKSNTVIDEAGGITQHISAYEVVHNEKPITFLDTPGHEAFTEMRQRGSLISDVAVLIVSAEDGVKTQTIEALESIINAGIPYVVAINKIDRPNANIDKTKQDLAENNMMVESYGGKIPSVNISAKTGEGVSELLNMILLIAELEELTGHRDTLADGFVLETNRDPKIGTMVTLIIKDGTLKQGDCVVAGDQLAKIKKIENFLGQTITEASFSSPVRVFGFSEPPAGSDPFVTFHNKKEAETYQQEKITKQEEISGKETMVAGQDQVIIPLVIKTDTFGTLEAVKREIAKLDNDQVKLKTVQTDIGAINENDIRILGAGNGIALGFCVGADATARDVAERASIMIETFDIIYKLSEWLAEEIERRRPLVTTETTLGRAKVIRIFSQTKNKFVLGGKVTDGKLSQGSQVKIWRRESEIGRGKINGLQQNKVEVKEVLTDNEFGLLLESKITVSAGDVIESFTIEKK